MSNDHEQQASGHVLQFAQFICKHEVAQNHRRETYLHQIVLLCPNADRYCTADAQDEVEADCEFMALHCCVDSLADVH